jgi:hypothetical protein
MRHVSLGLLIILFCCSPLVAQEISGPVTGTLGPGTYYVTGNISVPVGDSLVIVPGTDLLFHGGCTFAVYGYLQAVGTETDSINFLRRYSYISWEGINCYNYSSDDNRFEYCWIDGSGCQAIEMSACSPTIAHCLITNNEAGAG